MSTSSDVNNRRKELASDKPAQTTVLRMQDISLSAMQTLLAPYGLELVITQDQAIPGSFWGEEEAGLIEHRLYLRDDTPVHSALHEACHYICMSPARRACLDTNAGGDYDEENAVCYLQILLATQLPGLNKARMMADMDSWGYCFRLGSARAWFEEDAEEARDWLINHQIISCSEIPRGQCRQRD